MSSNEEILSPRGWITGSQSCPLWYEGDTEDKLGDSGWGWDDQEERQCWNRAMHILHSIPGILRVCDKLHGKPLWRKLSKIYITDAVPCFNRTVLLGHDEDWTGLDIPLWYFLCAYDHRPHPFCHIVEAQEARGQVTPCKRSSRITPRRQPRGHSFPNLLGFAGSPKANYLCAVFRYPKDQQILGWLNFLNWLQFSHISSSQSGYIPITWYAFATMPTSGTHPRWTEVF